MQSCGQGQYSYEPTEELEPNPKKRHGLFTRAFIEAIDSRFPQTDTNKDDKVSLNELRDYLTSRVPQYVAKYYDAEQDPEFTGIETLGEELVNSPLFKNPRIDPIVKVVTIAGCDVKFIKVRAGTFTMGQGGDKEDQREVTVESDFWLAETETTQRLWAAVMGDNPSEFKGDDLPVERVSWDDCQKFIEAIQEYAPEGESFKLPSEEHWEYACRAGSSEIYWWGDDVEDGEGKLNGYDRRGKESEGMGWEPFPFDDGYAKTAPVGTFEPNAWGFKDMLGNVREWCDDVLSGDSSKHVIRGGGWTFLTSKCQCGARESGVSNLQSNYLGFRLELCEAGYKPEVLPIEIGGDQKESVNFVWIPAGTFTMGSPDTEIGRDLTEFQHEVTIPTGFWLAETETTQALWTAVMGDNPSKFKGEKDSLKHPVERVSWDDCQEFIERIQKYAPPGKRFKLPSEEHWEYACRAGRQTIYWWGDKPEDGQGKANVYDECAEEVYHRKDYAPLNFRDGFSETAPVGSFAANPWGLKDMVGNVWEWCEDSWNGKLPTPDLDAEVSSKPRNAIRGGCWDGGARVCRSAYRTGLPNDTRANFLGFRLEMIDESAQ